jgi:hypothetical protein
MVKAPNDRCAKRQGEFQKTEYHKDAIGHEAEVNATGGVMSLPGVFMANSSKEFPEGCHNRP